MFHEYDYNFMPSSCNFSLNSYFYRKLLLDNYHSTTKRDYGHHRQPRGSEPLPSRVQPFIGGFAWNQPKTLPTERQVWETVCVCWNRVIVLKSYITRLYKIIWLSEGSELIIYCWLILSAKVHDKRKGGEESKTSMHFIAILEFTSPLFVCSFFFSPDIT